MSNVKEALQKLDAGNDNHWTQDGQAKLETVKFFNGGEAVSRDDLEKEFPGFNKSTAAGYWLTHQAAEQQAPQGGEGAAPEQGGGDTAAAPQQAPQAEQGTESPSATGEGAAPAETKAPEQPETAEDGTPNSDGDADREAELESLEDGLESGPNEIEKLETAFSEIQEHLSGLRGQVDNLNLEIDRVAQIEAKIHQAIQKAKRERGDHKPANAIQEYLASQKQIAAVRGQARRTLAESGVNLKELSKLVGKSPLDQSMARPTARRGRGSTGM